MLPDLAFTLMGQIAEHLAQMLAKGFVKHLPAALRDKHNVKFAIPFRMVKLAYSSIRFLLFVCLAAHVEEFLDGLPEMSNCYCHPGKAGDLLFD